MTAARVVLCGPAGSGKTTVGQLLATRLGVPFVDADDFHPPANRARMARGEALDDAARLPWLQAVHTHLVGRQEPGFVLACSALRAAYRDLLGAGLPRLHWVHLQVDPPTLAARLRARRHFFPPDLLASQLATWEPLRGGLAVDGTRPPDEVVATIAGALAAAEPPAAGSR